MARAGITRARLAAVGAELADELGFERVTLAEVARRCGVQTPSLYSHLRGTAELREQVTLLALEEMADRAADAVAGRSGKAALTGLANSYRDYAWQHPGRFAASAAAATLDAETAAGSAGPRHARFTEAVLRGYAVDPESHVHAVRMLGSTVRGFITLEMSGSFDHSSPPAAESWAQIIHGLDTLFHAWSTTPDEEFPSPRAEDSR